MWVTVTVEILFGTPPPSASRRAALNRSDLLLNQYRARRTWTLYSKPGSSCEWIVGRCGCCKVAQFSSRVSLDRRINSVWRSKNNFLCVKNRISLHWRKIGISGLIILVISLKWLWSVCLVCRGLWVDRAGRNTPWFSGYNIPHECSSQCVY